MKHPYFPDDFSIISELVALAEENSEEGLVHLQSVVSICQYRILYSLFHKYVPQGAKVLDWGVGNGHFSYFLVRAGYSAYGFSLENFPMGLKLADVSYHFVKGSDKEPIQLPFADRSFTAVVSVGVLEHVHETGGDDMASLREITRILKPDGVFVCYHLPNRYSLIEALASVIPHKYHHPYRYTVSTIFTLCKRLNLQLVEMKRYGFLPRNIWQHAPMRLRYSKTLALTWNFLDTLLAYPFTYVCQNYVFVAKKTNEDIAKCGRR